MIDSLNLFLQLVLTSSFLEDLDFDLKKEKKKKKLNHKICLIKRLQ
jgi:hypothetical protein